MKKLLAVCGFLFLSGCINEEFENAERAKALDLAKAWMQDHRLNGVVSCDHPNPYYCDFIPSDPRPPIELLCNGICRIVK